MLQWCCLCFVWGVVAFEAVWCGDVWDIIYGSCVFSNSFAITERSEMGLRDVHMFMYCVW